MDQVIIVTQLYGALDIMRPATCELDSFYSWVQNYTEISTCSHSEFIVACSCDLLLVKEMIDLGFFAFGFLLLGVVLVYSNKLWKSGYI